MFLLFFIPYVVKAGSGLVLGVVLVMGALYAAVQRMIQHGQAGREESDEIRANAFVAVNGKGEARAALRVFSDGPRLILFGEKGHTCAELVVNKDGPRLVLSDEQGTSRAVLTVNETGSVLVLSDIHGESRARLSVTEATLDLTDEKGIVRAGLTLTESTLSLCTTRMAMFAPGLSVDEDGPGLGLFGPDSHVIWSAP